MAESKGHKYKSPTKKILGEILALVRQLQYHPKDSTTFRLLEGTSKRNEGETKNAEVTKCVFVLHASQYEMKTYRVDMRPENIAPVEIPNVLYMFPIEGDTHKGTLMSHNDAEELLNMLSKELNKELE